MFCPKCGNQVPDGSKFCSKCGENLVSAAPEAPVAPVPPVTPEPPVAQEPPVAPVDPVTPPQPQPAKPAFVQPKKKLDKKLLIGIAAIAAVLVLLIGVITVISLIASSGNDEAYIYFSDGKYMMLNKLKQGAEKEIASARSDDDYTGSVRFSADGKYVYYFTKYDSDNYTGTLCRAQMGKLKKDPSKNDKYIDIIAANVYSYTLLENGSILYKNGDNTLYLYKDEESQQIAKEVSSYFLDEDENRLAYTIRTENEETYSWEYTLYGIVLKDPTNKMKLASDVSRVVDRTDFNNILITKEDEDGSSTLYSVGFEKDSEKIGARASVISTNDSGVYYTLENGKPLCLYDYVNDSTADADSKIEQPYEDDFREPWYDYDMVYGYDLSEDDYEELYTSCTQDLYWYGESSWWCYSMEDALDRDWGDNTEELHAATQRFIDQFADTADEDGWILVTPEVKAALQDIQQYADEPEEEWQWLWLCYEKYQAGTYVNWEAYDEAYFAWLDASDRNALREDLQNPENDFPVKTLYHYNKGEVTTIAENILTVSSESGALLYNTVDSVTEKVDLEDIYSYYEVEYLFDFNPEVESNVLIYSNNKTVKLPAVVAQTIVDAAERGDVALYFFEKEVLMNEEDGVLSRAEISGSSIGDFKLLADDAVVLTRSNNIVYYAANAYESSDDIYCDLYVYEKGESKRLAMDIMLEGIDIYEDGVILAETSYRSGRGYEYTLIKGDELTIIADNVTRIARLNNSDMLYISDNDLYFYDGKDREMIATDVDNFWCLDSMPIKTYLYRSQYDYAF